MAFESHIEVSISQDALHFWPEAGDVLPSRAYLSSPHHHTFHITACVKVQHSNRDVEFHDFKHELRKVVRNIISWEVGGAASFGPLSCEAIAQMILEQFPDNVFEVRVFEDEDCGAVVRRV